MIVAVLGFRRNVSIIIIIIVVVFIASGVKIPRVKSKVKNKRKAEVVTPRR